MREPVYVYLAGPDVFRPDAVARGRELVAICAEYGLTGLYPLDNQLPTGLDRAEARRWLRDANRARVRQAHIVAANLNFFRGGEPDSGTCAECQLADALGKPVYGYLAGAGDLRARLKAQLPHLVSTEDDGRDVWGNTIEDFGFPVNLMLDFVTLVTGDARACIERIAGDLREGRLVLPEGS